MAGNLSMARNPRIRPRRPTQGLLVLNVVGISSFGSPEHPNGMVEGGTQVDEHVGNTPANPIVLDSDSDDIDVRENRSLTPSTTRSLTPSTTEICRICFEPEQASSSTHADPIIPVGCHCNGDMSRGHRSCLTRWFQNKLPTNLELGCEVCKGPFGQVLQSAVLSKHLPVRDEGPMGRVLRITPSELILLQVPMEELDRLQVPIDTPPFSTLDRPLQEAIKKILSDQLLPDHFFEVLDRTCQAQRVHCEECVDQSARLSHVREMLCEYIDMVSVTKEPNDDDVKISACFPRNGSPPNIRIDLEDNYGQILRVPGSSPQAAVYAVSRKLCRHLDAIVAATLGEDRILLPRRMVVDSICTDRVASEPTPSSSAPGGFRRPCNRQFSYGQYVIYPLLDFESNSDLDFDNSDSHSD